jgi:hypothetical protein
MTTTTPTTFYDALKSQYDYVGSLFSYTQADDGNYYASALQTNLNTLNTDLTNNLSDQNSVLVQQDNVKRILDREAARLEQKKNSIDTILQGQNRMNSINASYAQRYAAYNRLMIYEVVIIAILLFINFFLSNFLPSSVILALTIIVYAVAIIYTYYALMDIWKRDALNYDKISPTLLSTPTQVKNAAATYSSIFGDTTNVMMGNLGQCIGQQCCAEGTYYDLSSNTCLTGTSTTSYTIDSEGQLVAPTGFTNLETAYKLKEIPLTLNSIVDAAPVEGVTKLEFSKF